MVALLTIEVLKNKLANGWINICNIRDTIFTSTIWNFVFVKEWSEIHEKMIIGIVPHFFYIPNIIMKVWSDVHVEK